jgi:hypothetical protein
MDLQQRMQQAGVKGRSVTLKIMRRKEVRPTASAAAPAAPAATARCLCCIPMPATFHGPMACWLLSDL